jgi:quinol monooxygenase YgiN
MITFIAHVPVSPENGPAFEEIMAYVSAKTRECEPDVLYYAFAKSVNDANTYVVIEVYRDRAAQAAHMQTEWVKASIPKTIPLFADKIDIKQYVSPGAEPVPAEHLTMART